MPELRQPKNLRRINMKLKNGSLLFALRTLYQKKLKRQSTLCLLPEDLSFYLLPPSAVFPGILLFRKKIWSYHIVYLNIMLNY